MHTTHSHSIKITYLRKLSYFHACATSSATCKVFLYMTVTLQILGSGAVPAWNRLCDLNRTHQSRISAEFVSKHKIKRSKKFPLRCHQVLLHQIPRSFMVHDLVRDFKKYLRSPAHSESTTMRNVPAADLGNAPVQNREKKTWQIVSPPRRRTPRYAN